MVKKIGKRAAWIIGIVIVVVLIASTCGIIFGVRSCNANDKGSVNKVEKMLVFENLQELNVGKPLVLQYYYYSNADYTSMLYSINNSPAVRFTDVSSGLAKNHKGYNGEGAKYYVDSGVQIIDTSALAPGYYNLVIFGETDEGIQKQICAKPYMFKIVAA